MKFIRLHKDTWAKTYLIIDKSTKMAAIVDPVIERIEADLKTIEEMSATLTHAICTHTHADHITAAFEMRKRTGCEYVMHEGTPSLAVSKYVKDGDVLEMGNTEITIHYTPGHTADSISVEAGGHLMTGDYLFTGEGGVGRDDLPSGRTKSHFDALQILKRFPGEIMIETGHDPPGTEMRDLAWNMANNPVLKMSDYQDYLSWQEEQWVVLGGVSKIKTALPANIFAEIPEKV